MGKQPGLIIGTAGHVDHGKTELIRRLTGIDTDRLREEKERGMTIVLGYAYFDLPSGVRAGIVDVPGHERFVHNMLAGVTGIDLVLLVVAADEGVMPQTREHVAILDLLGVENALVVITKADRADLDMIEVVKQEVAELLRGTTLDGAPVVVTSALTGEGFDELVRRLDEEAARVKPHEVNGPARMPIDRSFVIAGHGTVVTGSLIRGRLRLGDEVEILPAGVAARVRRLEVHGELMEQIAAPARVGANLADVAKDQVGRGNQLVEPGSIRPTWRMDVELRVIADAPRPLPHGATVQFHLGTDEVQARVRWVEKRDAVEPGGRAFAQIETERPIVAAAGDRFVIRAWSPLTTVGGGVVLDAHPRRHRRGRPEVIQRLQALRDGTPAQRAAEVVEARGRRGASAEQVARELQVTEDMALAALRQALDEGHVAQIGGRWLARQVVRQAREAVVAALEQYHRRHPLRRAMPLRELQQAAGGLTREVLDALLRELEVDGTVLRAPGGLRLASHTPEPTPQQQAAMQKALAAAERAGFHPPTRQQLLATLGGGSQAFDLLAHLIERGDLVEVGEYLWAAAAVEQAKRALAEAFGERPFTVAQARDVLGSTRKFVVPLMEYLDRTGFTVRRGDERRVRSGG